MQNFTESDLYKSSSDNMLIVANINFIYSCYIFIAPVIHTCTLLPLFPLGNQIIELITHIVISNDFDQFEQKTKNYLCLN